MTDQSKDNSVTADVIIVGGGLAGLSLTALLASRDIRVICVDRDEPATQQSTAYDGRTTAISFGSREILKAAGIWPDIEAQSCPIETIHISDGDSPVLLEFDSEEVEGEAFGWIAENSFLRQTLYHRVKSLPAARHLAPATVNNFAVHNDNANVILADGTVLTAPLVIGADGRGSFTRDFMGIDTKSWRYRQNAIVCCVRHEKPHGHIALENFRPEGPLAVLPMHDDPDGNHRSSLVWTEHQDTAGSFVNVPEDIFNAALNSRFPAHYGRVALSGARFTYPLGLIHAHQYTAPRMALIAEAAHGMHPIAGQGLNMGFRDVATIAELIIAAVKDGADTGAPSLLAHYQRQRRFDNTAMVAATDSLNKLFSNKMTGIRGIRKAGLHAIARLPVAKQFFMKQAMGANGLLKDFLHDIDHPSDSRANTDKDEAA